MALLHKATLHPTKLELLAAWLPERRWYQGKADAAVERVAAFRFDDPADEVGLETLLVRTGDGPVHQVPLTYRGAPLPDREDFLLGTMEHSVLGRRWVYDACGDPVYATVLADVIQGRARQAEEVLEADGHRESRPASMTVTGAARPTGAPLPAPAAGDRPEVVDDDPTVIVLPSLRLTLVRCLTPGTDLPGTVLTATWPGQPAPFPLAAAEPR